MSLRKGYTTGVHTLLAFRSALDIFLVVGGVVKSQNKKMENDDLDVTKGAKITVTLSESMKGLTLNPLPHQPYKYENLYIFAGVGVGIVTKDGLKPPKNFPAINPIPLRFISQYYLKFGKDKVVFCSVSVKNGEIIAKNTANEKVGVVGGISILGTTGWVKPISNSSYLASIKTESKFAKENGYSLIVLTLGSSSFKYARSLFDKEQIIEIGNFIYDSLEITKKLDFDEVLFIMSIGKATKVAQGYKNTHNRFGNINLDNIKTLLKSKLSKDIDINSTRTIKGILNQLNSEEKEYFKREIQQIALKVLKSWNGKTKTRVNLLIVNS